MITRSTKKIFLQFHHPIGNLFHYGHFIVDAILPFSLFYKHHLTSIPSPTELILPQNLSQQLGEFKEMFHKMFGLVVGVTYYPMERLEAEARALKQPVHDIDGYCFGPFPEDVFVEIDRLVKERMIVSTLLPNLEQNVVLCIDRGFKPIQLPKEYERKHNIHNTGSKRRRLLNHGELREILRQFAEQQNLEFQNVQLEFLPWEEQIRLFQRARVIFGQHGAGMCNIAFCVSNSKTVVIECSNWGPNTIQHLAMARNLSYFRAESTISHCNPQSLRNILQTLS